MASLFQRLARIASARFTAAASDDAVVLSLGPQHSFPLADFPKMLASQHVEPVLSQAMLHSMTYLFGNPKTHLSQAYKAKHLGMVALLMLNPEQAKTVSRV